MPTTATRPVPDWYAGSSTAQHDHTMAVGYALAMMYVTPGASALDLGRDRDASLPQLFARRYVEQGGCLGPKVMAQVWRDVARSLDLPVLEPQG